MSAYAALREAVAEVGRCVEALPPHERRESVLEAVAALDDEARLSFLLGTFVVAHDMRHGLGSECAWPMSDRTAAYQPYLHTVKVNDRIVGQHMKPLPDPFARTEVVIGWVDVLRALLRRRRLTVTVAMHADGRTVERVLALNPDHLGYAGTPSRMAWEAELHGRLSSLGTTQKPESGAS
jgi:hypothetical protein